MKKLKYIFLLLLLSMTNISASTSGSRSLTLINSATPLIPVLSALTIYLLLFVIYMYIVIIKEVDTKVLLKYATFIWVLTLMILITFFPNVYGYVSSLSLFALTYIGVAYKSLKKES